MKKYILVFFMLSAILGCAVKSPVAHVYKLESFSKKQFTKKPKLSILITQPEAVGGYQTQKMLYMKESYQLQAFAKNAWVTSPANMLYPLMLQSLKATGLFFAVTSTPYADKADVRLDTQIIALHQNFICKPSEIDFRVNVVLTHIPTSKVLASKIINLKVPCPYDTPYGGVIAANKATYEFTRILVDFVKSNSMNIHKG